MDAQKTGRLIAEARKERGLTQKDLAQALHVSAQAVSKWERGLNFPDLTLLEPLGERLGLTVSELLAGARGEEPGEELLRDSLRLVLTQVGNKLCRWKRLALACLGALLAIALVWSFRLVQTRTELLPQPVTILTPSELTAREEMTARTAGTSGVYLYGLTVADGTENYRVQMELWTDEGLAQTWMVAEEDNLTDVPRHQQVAFSYSADRARSSMKIGMTLAVSTWQTTLEGIPALDLGYLLSILNEQCEADPEHGVVLACWSLAAENGVTLEPDGGRTIIWSTPGWTGTVEKPRVLEGERFLLLRLLVQ